ncbi:probable G-protein coupled receptor 82 [Cebidichthys violaceus]|uniref:probable G-protein coupled receptor 82 n=1 Tax=Cebidichthys violaceus TaxID=271503 RepID=UPI0035CBC983
MSLNDPVSDQMEYTPDNASLSSVLSLCPTAATLFFLPSAYTLLFFTALPGNVLSLWVFLRRISTVSPVHVYLSHLSISNLMLALTTPFLAAYFARGLDWTQSGFLCQLVLHGITPVFYVNVNISMIILTWVALSRFAALIQHTHASRPSGCLLRQEGVCRRVAGGGGEHGAGDGLLLCERSHERDAAVKDGGVEVCYNPAVEIGGSLSAMLAVPVITLFFVFYLLVLLSYMTVLRHIRRSRRSTRVKTSQSLLGRVLRNIVVIQVVLSVCLLPYHIFKPIFISLVIDQRQLMYSPGNHCHPLSIFVELKNCLLLLAALRSATDPLMYYLLDKTFRHKTLRLLRCHQNSPRGRPTSSVTGSDNQRAGHLEDGTVDLTQGTVL